MNKLKQLWEYDWFKVVASLLLGGVIGVVFYPTKSVTEKERTEIKESYELKIEELTKRHSEETQTLSQQLSVVESKSKEVQAELSKKVETLVTENSQLKQSVKKRKFKLVKPDGTIIEKEVEESNTEQVTSVVSQVKEEFNQKIKSIENQWKTIHEQRVTELKRKFDEEIAKARSEVKTRDVIVEREKIVEVNKKSLRPELGASYNGEDVMAYLHASYPIAGPIFIGGGVSGNKTSFGDARIGVGLEF